MNKDVNQVISEYIKMVEKISNGRMNVLDFGDDMVFFRGEIHMIKMVGDFPGIHVSEMARNFNITRAAVSKTAKKLEQKGVLIRKIDTEDKKILRLFLTDKGKKAYLAHQKYHHDFDEPLFDYLNMLEKEQLTVVEEFLKRANLLIDNHF